MRLSVFVTIVAMILVSEHSSGLAKVHCDPVSGSQIEKRVWSDICKSGEAHLTDAEAISARFLEQITEMEPYAGEVKRLGITISGGKITGPLILRHLKFEGPTMNISSNFDSIVDISEAAFVGDVSFHGAVLPLGLMASRAIIGGSLLLGEFDDTNYNGNRVPSGTLLRSLSAPNLRVNGDFVLSGATMNGGIELTGAEIKGAVTFMYVVTDHVDLSASDIGNQLNFFDCWIMPDPETKKGDDDLNLYSIRTHQTVFFNRDYVDNDILLEGAQIDGDLILLGSDLSTVNVRGARVSGALITGLNEGGDPIWTHWHGESVLDAADSHFGSIRAPEILDVWPEHIYMEDFSYGLYSPDYCGTQACSHNPAWYASWLARQAEARKSFAPYKQVVDMLMLQGDTVDAEDLAIIGHNVERRDALAHSEYIRYAALLFYGLTIGYGYKLQWAFYWSTIFLLLGAVLFKIKGPIKKRYIGTALIYSFDMLLPIVRLQESNYKIELQGCVKYYFFFHKIIGWALGLMIIAAVTGIAK